MATSDGAAGSEDAEGGKFTKGSLLLLIVSVVTESTGLI